MNRAQPLKESLVLVTVIFQSIVRHTVTHHDQFTLITTTDPVSAIAISSTLFFANISIYHSLHSIAFVFSYILLLSIVLINNNNYSRFQYKLLYILFKCDRPSIPEMMFPFDFEYLKFVLSFDVLLFVYE